MIFDINTFRSATQGGFQKLEHYHVRFPYPPIMLAGNYPDTKAAVQDLEFFADSVDFAGVQLATHNVTRYGYGPSEKKPVFPQFEDIMITFYGDADAQNLTFFQAWLNSIVNFDLSSGITPNRDPTTLGIPYRRPQNSDVYEMAYKDDYAVDAWITMFDNAEKAVTTLYMRQCYPIAIPSTKMGWALTQDVMRVTVMFAFNDWFIVYGDPDQPGQQAPIVGQPYQQSSDPRWNQIANPPGRGNQGEQEDQ